MKIFVAHNFYQRPGGEDGVFADETALLEQNGHTVYRFTKHNDDINHMSKLKTLRSTFGNPETYQELRELFRKHRFDVAHFHNTFPLISPSAYAAAQDEGIPVIQTLHNYRLMCPASTFFRDGQVCEDCLGKAITWPGVLHGCYRDSRVQSAVVTGMLTFHRIKQTWSRLVNKYIALTQFAKNKFVEAGMPSEKIVVKPNFIPDPGVGTNPGNHMVFIGRLTTEKGVRTLLRAWESNPDIPLKLIGNGPLFEELEETIRSKQLSVELLGQLDRDQVFQVLKQARCLIFPTELYETFGRVTIEAFACGKPVIASRIGAVAELVENGKTGLQFTPGDAHEIATHAKFLWDNPDTSIKMGQEARTTYEVNYTSQSNYLQLIEIYKQVKP